MDKYKKLKFNSIIFAIGNFGSSLLSFLMIPIYTHVLSSAQYGTVDFFQTTVSLLAPLIALSMFEGILRFSMNVDEERDKVITTTVISTIFFIIIAFIIIVILKYFIEIKYSSLLMIVLFLTVFNYTLQNYSRAANYIKIYTISGVVTSVVLVISNLLFLIVFKWGIIGYLISIIFSLIGSIIVNSFFTDFWSKFHFNKFSFSLLKRMLNYSVPLMPNSISWWLTSDVSKFFIVFFIGVSANGQFALASKPGAILSLIFTIFLKSWQLSATEEIDSPDKSEFFSDIFKKISELQFVLTTLIIAIVHPVFNYLFSSSYNDSWKLVPFLLFAVMYSNFAAFLGVSYLAKMKTKNILFSTILTGVINVAIDFILIPHIGIVGAALGSMISFICLFLFRLWDTRKIVQIVINKLNFFGSQTILIVLTMAVLFLNNILLELIVELCCVLLVLCLNKSLLSIIWRTNK